MEVKAAARLTDEEKRMTEELVRLCRDHEGSSLSFPSEDGSFFVLVREEGILACALALYDLEPHLYECAAFTRPDMRRRGFFSAALDRARRQFQNDDFSFVTDGRCQAAAFVLKKIRARYWYCEHKMCIRDRLYPALLRHRHGDREALFKIPEHVHPSGRAEYPPPGGGGHDRLRRHLHPDFRFLGK